MEVLTMAKGSPSFNSSAVKSRYALLPLTESGLYCIKGLVMLLNHISIQNYIRFVCLL